jgi:hypothetical protein
MKAAVQEFGRDDFREDVWDELADGMHYVYDDDKLAAALRDLGERRGTTGNRIYYLAVPPAAFEGIVAWVGKHKARKGWTRVIVEKPFGHDLESAQDLNALLHKHFDESQIFRIDHYPGQGDRPEHAGASVRERDLRADLEPPSSSTTSRSRLRRRSGSRDGPSTTSGPVRSGTSFRTTCCS